MLTDKQYIIIYINSEVTIRISDSIKISRKKYQFLKLQIHFQSLLFRLSNFFLVINLFYFP